MTAKPDYAGLRSYRRARSTGRFVGVYDGIESGMDTDGGRWQTVCEDHGSVISHETLKLAMWHSSAPEGWCEPCGDQLRAALARGWQPRVPHRLPDVVG